MMADVPRPLAKTAQTKTIGLQITMASGKELASIQALTSWTVADLMDIRGLEDQLKAKTKITALLHETQMLEASKTLSQSGLKDGAVLQAVVTTVPTLHLFKPRSSSEFGRDWIVVGGDPIAQSGVQHHSMKDAPVQAKKIVKAMQ